jgi:hypothetical protein
MRMPILALLLVVATVGCDSADDEQSAEGQSVSARKAMSPEAAQAALNMVEAVPSGDGKALVHLKFELNQRPEVDKPVEISLVFIPVTQLERLYARFSAQEGLEVVRGGETEQIARPVVGSAITHTLTVVPKRNGIFNLQAAVLMDSHTESLSRNFSIPLIAGTGIGEWSQKKVAARGDDAP